MKTLENNKMKIPQNYEAPALEMLEVEVEKGFALSPYSSPHGNYDDGMPD